MDGTCIIGWLLVIKDGISKIVDSLCFNTMGYIVMCGPKGYDILAVLVRNMVLILPILVPKQKGLVSLL